MVRRGHVRNGLVVPDDDLSALEGREVSLVFSDDQTDPAVESLMEIIKSAQPTGLPDLATRLDDYLYGDRAEKHGG